MAKLDIVNANNVIESNPQRAYFKLKNTGGPKGDKGDTGERGPQGATGPQGPAGLSASVKVGSTTTLNPGANATVTNSGDSHNVVLDFGIPTGAQGPKGDTGSQGPRGPQGFQGPKGDTGAAATVQVGNTNTGAPGTNAQVTNVGTQYNAKLNFTIPRGDKGETGATGAQGPKGDKGDKGDTGQAATIEVGSTTTTNPGTSATVTNSGTTSAAVLNFGIPRGAAGSVKSEVVSELPETGEGDTFYLVNREATTQTATGKTINFTNSENTGDITDAQIDGETSQNGTPTPDAPVGVQTVTGENVVKICGKNILNTDNTVGEQTQNGVTASMSGSVISIDGEGTGADGSTSGMNRTWTLTTQIPLAAGTYSISGTLLSGSWTAAAQSRLRSIRINLSSGTYKEVSASNGSTALVGNTFTLTAATNVVSVQIMVYGQVKFYDAEFGLQLELGNQASTYEAYKSQSYEVNLGKNLFEVTASSPSVSGGVTYTKISDNSFSIASDGSSSWARADIALPQPLELNTTYTFKANFSSTNPSITSVRVAFRTASAEFRYYDLADGQTASLSTGSSAITLLRIYISTNTAYNATVTFTDVQLEKGSQPTSYAAYFEPIELCKIGTYQDYIYKSGGKWYKHKAVGKVVLDGSESWNDFSSGASKRYYTGDYSSLISGLPQTTDALSDYFTFDGVESGTLTNGKFFFNMSAGTIVANGNITITNNGLESVSACTTWLQSNNVRIYYQLATATEEEITNQALITQLDNLASAALYSGANNIFTITPNEAPTLEIDYVTYDKYNQNKVYIWNDTLQQWQIIVQ